MLQGGSLCLEQRFPPAGEALGDGKQADCCYLQPHSLGPYRVSGRRLRPSALPTWGWWGRWRVLLSWLSLVPRFLPQESGSIMLTRRPYPHPKVILLFIKPGLPDKSRGPHVAIIPYIFFSPKKCSIPSHIENTIKKYIGNSSLHNMPRKINCPDLTLNSYANLDQHKIKLDHNENLICFLKYKLLVKKKKIFTFRNQTT